MNTLLPQPRPRRWASAVGALAVAVGLSACVAPKAPVVPPTAFIYTQIEAPLQTDVANTSMRGERIGESTARYLYIPFTNGIAAFAWGDASIEKSAKNAGLETVQYSDYKFLSVLGVYAQTTFRAHGSGS